MREVVYYYAITDGCTAVINWLSFNNQVIAVENRILSAKGSLEVVRGCDGSGVLFMLFASMLIFPTSIGKRAIGLFIALGFTALLNSVRIVILYFVMAYQNNYFILVHELLAPTFILALSCVCFYAWAVYAARS
ncbi:MAG: exosortase family protein XrtM [Pseudomonadales bacterium]|nr:exosortase family protein XrtM [Pseudomonadales bacterium]